MALGRPWRPYAKVVYINSVMEQHIIAEGRNNWNKKENESTAFLRNMRVKDLAAMVDSRLPWIVQLDTQRLALYTKGIILEGWKLFSDIPNS
ncbi:pectinesterase family protein [Olivibacter sp. SDN3]|uniref:pectinesterase family protein n=1 Tax=Olivibacter sp. SDN3 TaxID=2764720 RepID=UPI001C9E9718|nr:pectinesterase family protein [Olivibacter sp. SDN3]